MIHTIYVPTNADFLYAAKNVAIRYGWFRKPQLDETWMIFDIDNRKISFTFVPPDLNDKSLVVATKIQDLTSNMPDITTYATPYIMPPSIADSDQYAYTLTLIS